MGQGRRLQFDWHELPFAVTTLGLVTAFSWVIAFLG